MNRVEVSGGLTRDATYDDSGAVQRLQFTIAVNGTRWDSQQNQQVVKTMYVTLVAWGPQALEWMSLKKGDEVHAVGELDQYRNPEKDQPSTRVTVFQMSLLREGRAHRQQHAPVHGRPESQGPQPDWSTPPPKDPWS